MDKDSREKVMDPSELVSEIRLRHGGHWNLSNKAASRLVFFNYSIRNRNNQINGEREKCADIACEYILKYTRGNEMVIPGLRKAIIEMGE